MNIPRFNAEASLYEMNRHYCNMLGTSVQANIDVIQSALFPIQSIHCGPCYRDDTGDCVKDCLIPCPPGRLPDGCPTDITLPCSPNKCPPPPPPCTCTTTRCCGSTCTTSAPVNC